MKYRMVFDEQPAKGRRFSPWGYLVTAMLLFAGNFIVIGGFASMFGESLPDRFVLASACVALAIAGIPWLPRYRKTCFLGMCILVALETKKFFPEILNGIRIMWNHLLRGVNVYFDECWSMVDYDRSVDVDTFWFFFVLAQVLGLLLVLALMHAKLRTPWLLISLVCMFVGVICDCFASDGYVIAYAGFVFLLVFSESHAFMRSEKKHAYVLVAAGVILVLALLSKSVFRENYFRDEVVAKDYRTQFRDKINEWINGEDAPEIENPPDYVGLDQFVTMGMAGGYLGRDTDGITSKGEDHLYVVLPKNAPQTYLRGFVGSVYTGRRWTEFSGDAEGSFHTFMDNFGYERPIAQYTYDMVYRFFLKDWDIGFSVTKTRRFSEYYGNIIVENIGASTNYVYAPYCAGNSGRCVSDINGYWKPDFVSVEEPITWGYIYNEYGLPFHFSFTDSSEMSYAMVNGDMAEIGMFERYDNYYQNAMRSYYLHIPEECKRVKELMQSTGDVQKDIVQVLSFLLERCQYDKTPGAVPEGEDYIENFLFKSRRGYCMHFASAGVMLFRAMGIPARYAEGYVVRKSAIDRAASNGTAEVVRLNPNGRQENIEQEYVGIMVDDTCAHAWVEVYIENYGWYPIDVTPGYATGMEVESFFPYLTTVPTAPTTKPTQGGQTGNTPTSTGGKDRTPTPTHGNAQKPSVPITGIPEALLTLTPEVSQKPNEADGAGKKGGDIPWMPILLVVVVVLVPVVLFLRYRYRSGERLLSFRSEDNNASVLAYYRAIHRLLPYWDVKQEDWENDSQYCERAKPELPVLDAEYELTSAVESALLAAFSQETVSDEEKKKIDVYYRRLRRATYEKLPWWRRFLMKYLGCQ